MTEPAYCLRIRVAIQRRVEEPAMLRTVAPSLWSIAIVFAIAVPSGAVPRLGTNLSGPADWNTELPFVDVFRLSRQWISQKKGQPWGKGPALALDENGYVTKLEPDCSAETLLCTIDGGHYPKGQYTVLYDGKGRLEFSNARLVSSQPDRLVIEPNPERGAFFLRIVETDPSDYLRHIRVIMPGFETTYQQEPFHPAFLKRWQGMACLRFMDWMETNGSKIEKWSQRPTPQSATYAEKGVPIEVMIDLANRLKADPWFCMPHLADDDYVRNFASLVKEKLDPTLKVYVEYSNEVWNGQFEQSRYAGQQGQALKFAEKPWEAAWKFTAHRSVQIFAIWEAVFGGKDRLVRVIPSQAANTYVAEQILTFNDTYKNADALAIAPYISCNVPLRGDRLSAEKVKDWTVDQALDYLQSEALPESIRWIQANKKTADKYKIKLIAYEGGQHMVGVGGAENDQNLTSLFHAANAHPRLGVIYQQHLDAWSSAGGDLFCHFSSVSNWSKWGSWGVYQYYDEDPAKSAKYMALIKWAKQQGQSVHVPQ